jgi:hypothetical protein
MGGNLSRFLNVIYFPWAITRHMGGRIRDAPLLILFATVLPSARTLDRSPECQLTRPVTPSYNEGTATDLWCPSDSSGDGTSSVPLFGKGFPHLEGPSDWRALYSEDEPCVSLQEAASYSWESKAPNSTVIFTPSAPSSFSNRFHRRSRHIKCFSCSYLRNR